MQINIALCHVLSIVLPASKNAASAWEFQLTVSILSVRGLDAITCKHYIDIRRFLWFRRRLAFETTQRPRVAPLLTLHVSSTPAALLCPDFILLRVCALYSSEDSTTGIGYIAG
ncbi:hypothetical protein BD413DRAFT_288195 [Trametes elegans]|nr:hypothetical protein BD413DRAFT_288195 [Trametes elegans]